MRMAPDIASWIDAKVASRRFKDDTHAVEWCVGFIMEQERKFGSLEAFEAFLRATGARTVSMTGTTQSGMSASIQAAMDAALEAGPTKEQLDAAAREHAKRLRRK